MMSSCSMGISTFFVSCDCFTFCLLDLFDVSYCKLLPIPTDPIYDSAGKLCADNTMGKREQGAARLSSRDPLFPCPDMLTDFASGVIYCPSCPVQLWLSP